jgi:hypothetical protein
MAKIYQKYFEWLWSFVFVDNWIFIQTCLGKTESEKNILIDQFTQEWNSIIYHSPKCLNYRLFKEF